MPPLQEIKTLFHIAFSPIRGATHADRLNSFYAGQATGYDAFRKRLLRSREALFASLDYPENGVWVDLGGGTGANLENARPALKKLQHIYIVDLCKPLLEVARQRIAANQWDNVTAVEADATAFQPPEGHADLVTFSYSLTMIPDWHKAIAHAARLLRPGGRIGVVDFYVSRKYPAEGCRKHGWCTRSFWPLWFGIDNVFLSPDHLPVLCDTFVPRAVVEEKAPVPYMPFRVPMYRFIGEKH